MATFQITQGDQTYQVDAADEQSALAALDKMNGTQSATAGPSGPLAGSAGNAYDVAKGLQSAGNAVLGLFPNVGADVLNLAHTLGLTSSTGADAPTLASVETAAGAPPREDIANQTLAGKIGKSTGENVLGSLVAAGAGGIAKPLELAATEGLPFVKKGANVLGNLVRSGVNALREGGTVAAAHPGVALTTDIGASAGQAAGAPIGADLGGRVGYAVGGQQGEQRGRAVGATVGGYTGALAGAVPGMGVTALARPGGVGIPRLGGKDFGTGAEPGSLNASGASTINLEGGTNTQALLDKFNTIRQQTDQSITDAAAKMSGPGTPQTKSAAAEGLRNHLQEVILPQVREQEKAAYAKIENLPVDAKPILNDFLTTFNPKVDLAGKPATAKELKDIQPFLQQLQNYAKKPTVSVKDFIGRFGLSTTARSKAQHIMSTDQSSGILDQLRGKIIDGIKKQYEGNEDVANALNITTWKNQTFKEGPIGRFLQPGRPDAERTPAKDLAPSLMSHPATGPAINDIATRMKSPETKAAAEDLIGSTYREIANDPSKGPEKAMAWYNKPDTQQLMAAFPEMKATMDSGAADLGRAIAVRDEFKKNTFMSKYGEDPDKAAQKLLKSDNSNVEVPQIMNKIQNDPEALEAFRESTIKAFLKNHNVAGANNLRAALADMGTESTRRNLGAILGSDQYGNLQSILTAMNKMKLGNEGIFSSTGRRVAGVAGRLIGASLGPRHMGSGSLIIAGIRAKAGQKIAQSVFKNVDADTLIAKAASDPGYRKFILSKVPENKQEVQFAYKQLRRLTALQSAGSAGEGEVPSGSAGNTVRGVGKYIRDSIVTPAR